MTTQQMMTWERIAKLVGLVVLTGMGCLVVGSIHSFTNRPGKRGCDGHARSYGQ